MAYLDQMYTQTPPTSGVPTGMTQQQSPQKGIWQSYGMGWSGDQPQPQDWKDPGFWKADPNVDYGQAPIAGAQRTFDNDGNASGWAMNGNSILSQEEYDRMMQTGATTKGWRAPPSVTRHGDYYIVPSQWEGENHLSRKGRLSKYATMAAGATILGAGAAAYAGAGGALGGAGTSGLTGAEAAALSAEAAGGVTGIGAGGTTAAEAAAAAGIGGSAAPAGLTASSPEVLAGLYGGAGEPLIGGMTLSEAGAAGAIPGVAGTSSGSGSFLELLKEYGPKAYELVAGNQGQDGKGGSRGIIDLLAGYYSSQQNKDLSGNLKGMYSDQRGLQNPYNALLRASYEDPNVFYGSNQWKGLESVYRNKIDRLAAKGGTNANAIDREVKLNNYAMQELEKFRGGLKDAVNAYDPTRLAPIAEKGYNVEANANNPMWAGAGRAGTGGPGQGGYSTENYIKTISSTASTAEDIYNLISKWFT